MTSIDEIDLWKWLETAKAGDRVVYHRGFLAYDRANFCGRSEPRSTCRCGQCWRARMAGEVAHVAFSRHEAGRAILFQRRIGERDYEYILQVAHG